MASETKDQSACRVVKAPEIVENLLHEVSQDLARLGRSPLLVGFLANNDPAARKYANWTRKTCEDK
jgi:methylenetetrahydrofolate dehydrogenase (NAD+)